MSGCVNRGVLYFVTKAEPPPLIRRYEHSVRPKNPPNSVVLVSEHSDFFSNREKRRHYGMKLWKLNKKNLVLKSEQTGWQSIRAKDGQVCIRHRPKFRFHRKREVPRRVKREIPRERGARSGGKQETLWRHG
jgi:hypothetical protein